MTKQIFSLIIDSSYRIDESDIEAILLADEDLGINHVSAVEANVNKDQMDLFDDLI